MTTHTHYVIFPDGTVRFTSTPKATVKLYDKAGQFSNTKS